MALIIFSEQRLAALRADPDLSTFVNFFFPDRHGFFDLFDGKPAGGEGRLACADDTAIMTLAWVI